MRLDESYLNKQDFYIVGVSGGPDSMCLLDLLMKNGYKVAVSLVNYHKREDSDLDYAVVKRYCDLHLIPLEYLEIFNYEKGNFQAQARTMRYDFYVECANKYQASAILLAHHKDDFLETALMAKERKMVDVFYGILTCSKYHDLKVIRPLMHYYKDELLAYCNEHKIDYRIDSSNLESHYTRNYYRNEILSHYAKEDKEKLYEEIMLHNKKVEALYKEYQEFLDKYEVSGKIQLEALLNYPKNVGFLHYYLHHYEGIDGSKISRSFCQALLISLHSPKPNLKINIQVNFVLIKAYDNIYIQKEMDVSSYYYVITEEMIGDYGAFQIANQGHDREGVCLKADDFPLVIRTRQAGDKISLSYGEKKLSRLFIDAKIPNSLRESWPVVLNRKGEIILVPKIAKNKAYLLEKPSWFVIQY